MGTEFVVVLDGVSKNFGSVKAVDQLSLQVPSGAVFGLLGPNGAGKTTTLRILLDVAVPDSGSVELFGGPGSAVGRSHRIGYLPEERGLYRRMKVIDHLVFLGEMRGMSRKTGRSAALHWLERLGLGEWAGNRVRELSRGMQQKVQFMGAVLHGPQLLVLDEPFAGLDTINADDMGKVVSDLARAGTTVIFSTHIMEQAEMLCDQICIMSRGHKLVEGTVDAVKYRHAKRRVRLLVAESRREEAGSMLAAGPGVAEFERQGEWFQLVPAAGTTGAEIVASLVDAGVCVDEFETTTDTLRRVFLDLVRRANTGAPDA